MLNRYKRYLTDHMRTSTPDARPRDLRRAHMKVLQRTLLWPWFLVLLVGLCCQAWARPENTSSRVDTIGAPAFAVADFDGDKRPDLARVQAGQTSSYQAQYWIQLQLTQTGRQLIGITAPIGGLRVFASDVNGDHAIDLVLSTTWMNRPVAILLNDGHGRFTPESPSAFPGAFRRASNQRFSQSRQVHCAATATQSRPVLWFEHTHLQRAQKARPRANASFAILLSAPLLNHRGRAPPSIS